MSVSGAFFKVTGKMGELDRIMEGISSAEGRLTPGESMSLDLWLEMKDEWFRLHDAAVVVEALKAARPLADSTPVDERVSAQSIGTFTASNGIMVRTDARGAISVLSASGAWSSHDLDETAAIRELFAADDGSGIDEEFVASNGLTAGASVDGGIGVEWSDPRGGGWAFHGPDETQALREYFTQKRTVSVSEPGAARGSILRDALALSASQDDGWKTDVVEEARAHYGYGVNSGTFTCLNTVESVRATRKQIEQRTMGSVSIDRIEARTVITATSPYTPSTINRFQAQQ